MPPLESVVRILGLRATTGKEISLCQSQKEILEVPLKFTETSLYISPTRADGEKREAASPQKGQQM